MPKITQTAAIYVLLAIALVGVIVLAIMGKPVPTLLEGITIALLGGGLGLTVPATAALGVTTSSAPTSSAPDLPPAAAASATAAPAGTPVIPPAGVPAG